MNCSIKTIFAKLLDQSSEIDVQFENLQDVDKQQFLKKIITIYGKHQLDVSSFLNALCPVRISHIFSAYLLGKSLYDNVSIIRSSIDKVINQLDFPENDEHSDEDRFSFIWALTAIYHDFGYMYEGETNMNITPQSPDSSLWSLNIPEEKEYVPSIYTNLLLKNYCHYKKCKRGSYDHGIFGGKKLYQDINKANIPEGMIKIEKVYFCAAWTIAVHNIFFNMKQDEYTKCYKKCGLRDLILDRPFREISVNSYPFLFLLSLVDNLEPYKRIPQEKVFDCITLEFSESSKITIDAKGLSGEDFKKYAKGILDLQSWLTDVSDSNRKLDDPNVSKVIDVSILSSNNNENQNI